MQLKEVLVKEVHAKLNVQMDPKMVRLREKVNMKLGRVFHNPDILKSHRIYDRQPFCLEALTHEESTSSGQLLLYVKLFNIFDYELTFPPEEIFITQATSFQELSTILNERFNLPVS